MFLHPTVLLSVVLLIANDHWLKSRFANTATGKFSDVAGVFFFPLLLVSLLEVARWACRASRWPYRHNELLVAIMATALGFVAIKTVPVAASAYTTVVSLTRWSSTNALSLLTNSETVASSHVSLARDPTDLLVLPILAATYLVGRPFAHPSTRGTSPRDATAFGVPEPT